MWSIELRHFQRPWTSPNSGFKVTPFFYAKYLTNGWRYGHSCYKMQIENCTQAFEWCHFERPWLSEIFNDTKHRVASLRQLSFLFLFPSTHLQLTLALRSLTDKLQRVLNAAARLVSGTRKFDRGLSCLLHVDLHWLDVPERVQYKLGVTVRRCQQHKAPQYLTDCVTPASDIASRQRLRSASRHQLLVPRYQLSSLGRRFFAVAGPTTWNSLSADLRDPTCSDESFRSSLKTFLFAKY